MTKRLIPSFLSVILITILQTGYIWAQETTFNPDDVEPTSFFDRYQVDMPEFVIPLIIEKNMSYFPYFLKEGQDDARLVFTESEGCHVSGCTVVILSLEDDVLFDPIIFVSDSDIWYNDEYSFRETPLSDICVTQDVAFMC